jgi:hypothetical protein
MVPGGIGPSAIGGIVIPDIAIPAIGGIVCCSA